MLREARIRLLVTLGLALVIALAVRTRPAGEALEPPPPPSLHQVGQAIGDELAGPERPPLRPVPDFHLVDSHGAPFDRSRLLGRVWLAAFVFTSCAGTCPAITSRMRVLQAALPEEVRLVSFSVDPERDTPERLLAYARKNGRQEGRWFFLTGERPEIVQLATQGFRQAGEDDLLNHRSSLTLVDHTGWIRGFYPTDSEEGVTTLLRDVAVLDARVPASARPPAATSAASTP